MPKSSILVSSDHDTFTQFSSESLANFRRVCTCTFLSSYQLFSWLLYGPSCLEIIDKILPCSSGLIPHRSHDHWNYTRWDLAWSPRPREIDSYFVFLPFANNRTNCCHLLTKLLDRWSCSPFQPCVGLQSCPWHPWTALCSWPWWRVWDLIDWLLLCPGCILY